MVEDPQAQGCCTQRDPPISTGQDPSTGSVRRAQEGAPVHCPYCRHTDTRVLDSRVADDGGSIRRRRTCPACEGRVTTGERMRPAVLKPCGAGEPFPRDKAISGVRKACKG